MSQELKVLVNILLQFMKTVKCEEASFSFDYDGNPNYNNKFYCRNTNQNISLPIDIDGYLSTYLENLDDFRGDSGTGSEYWGYEMVVNPENRTIKTFGEYDEYSGEDETRETYVKENDEEFNVAIKSLIDEGFLPPYEFSFNGGGDSGYLDGTAYDKNGNSFSVPQYFDDLCYVELSNFGAWGDNDGSQGKIIVDPDERLVRTELVWNIANRATEILDIWKI